MGYHIDTGLIWEKFKEDCECPLCEIKKVVEEGYLYEFLNDAVMEDDTRIKVGKEGFCDKHFNMLFSRPNKLSVALQMQTRVEKIDGLFGETKNLLSAKKKAKEIDDSLNGCAICDYINASMVKYYKTVAQMFARERNFAETLLSGKGFCLHHYSELLRYSGEAGFLAKGYLSALNKVEKRNIERLKEELQVFCNKHDYRNANMPLGSSETALNRLGEKFYGKKTD